MAAACPGLFAALFPPSIPSAPAAPSFTPPSYSPPVYSMPALPTFPAFPQAQVPNVPSLPQPLPSFQNNLPPLPQPQQPLPSFQNNLPSLPQSQQPLPSFQNNLQMPFQQTMSQLMNPDASLSAQQQLSNLQQSQANGEAPQAQFQMQLPQILPLPNIAPPAPQIPEVLPPQPEVTAAPPVQNTFRDTCYEQPPNVGNANCFINTSGFFCCHQDLNSFIEETTNQHMEDPRWMGCNNQRMAVDFEKYAHDRFQLDFETIIGAANLCGKNHFMGDWMCKSRLPDGKVIMVYAHPTANNFGITGQLQNGTGGYALPSFGL